MRVVGHYFRFLLLLSVFGASSPAFGLRPFDGTDAAVAEPAELNMELGPLQSLSQGSEHALISPHLALSYGFARNWEMVWEGELVHPRSEEERKTSLVEHGVFFKHVIREGSLQNQPGPSVATEIGLLLPGINADRGTGTSVAGIVSYRWPVVEVHFNLLAAITREHDRALFADLILEGPREWRLRPAAEVISANEIHVSRTRSVLVGAIWRASDVLEFDAGVREARMEDQRVRELRAGVTYSWLAR